MDKLATLISLNDAKKTIDDLIVRIRQGRDEDSETDARKLVIIGLTVLGALVLVAVIAYVVYKHFSTDGLDDLEDWDDLDDVDDEDDDTDVLVSDDDIDE